MQRKSPLIFQDSLGFHELISGFLLELCEMELAEVIPVVQHLSRFLAMEFEHDPP